MAQFLGINAFNAQVATSDDWSSQLGEIGFAPDADNYAGAITVNTLQGQRRCVLVKNTSGVALPCGAGLKWMAGGGGKYVQKCTSLSQIVGFVPPAINGSQSNTVADGQYFWMITLGPSYVLKSTANVAEFDKLEGSPTAGQVKSSAGTAVDDVLAATAWAADTSGTATLVRAYVDAAW